VSHSTRQDTRKHIDKTFSLLKRKIEEALDHAKNELIFAATFTDLETWDREVICDIINRFIDNRRAANALVLSHVQLELIIAYRRALLPDNTEPLTYLPPYCPLDEPPGFAINTNTVPVAKTTVATDTWYGPDGYYTLLKQWWQDDTLPLPRPPYESQPHIVTMPIVSIQPLADGFALVPVPQNDDDDEPRVRAS
jgi:hypothetical protein